MATAQRCTVTVGVVSDEMASCSYATATLEAGTWRLRGEGRAIRHPSDPTGSICDKEAIAGALNVLAGRIDSMASRDTRARADSSTWSAPSRESLL